MLFLPYAEDVGNFLVQKYAREQQQRREEEQRAEDERDGRRLMAIAARGEDGLLPHQRLIEAAVVEAPPPPPPSPVDLPFRSCLDLSLESMEDAQADGIFHMDVVSDLLPFFPFTCIIGEVLPVLVLASLFYLDPCENRRGRQKSLTVSLSACFVKSKFLKFCY